MDSVIELLRAPRSGPEPLLRGDGAVWADTQLAELVLREMLGRDLQAGERNRILRALRLSYWTGLHDSAELYMSPCEQERYYHALLLAETNALHLLSPAALADAWALGEDDGDRVAELLPAA